MRADLETRMKTPPKHRGIIEEFEPVVVSRSGRTIKPSQKIRDAYGETRVNHVSPVKRTYSPTLAAPSTEVAHALETHSLLQSDSATEQAQPTVEIPDNTLQNHYICPKCNEEFDSRKLFAEHKRTHERLFSCNVCSNEFKTAAGVRLHSRVHTGERPYRCSLCKQRFRRKDYMLAHKKIHTGERPFTCNECMTSFGLHSSLIRHMRLHTGEKPYTCEVCNESFTNAHVLKIHTSSHTGHRPYVCEECGMSFVVATNLKRHVMIHTGERPFMCEECGKRFAQLHHMTLHMRTSHSGVTPYLCTSCNSQFKSASKLNNHLETVHHIAPYIVPVGQEQFTKDQQAAAIDLLNNICRNMDTGQGISWNIPDSAAGKQLDAAITQAVSTIENHEANTANQVSSDKSITFVFISEDGSESTQQIILSSEQGNENPVYDMESTHASNLDVLIQGLEVQIPGCMEDTKPVITAVEQMDESGEQGENSDVILNDVKSLEASAVDAPKCHELTSHQADVSQNEELTLERLPCRIAAIQSEIETVQESVLSEEQEYSHENGQLEVHSTNIAEPSFPIHVEVPRTMVSSVAELAEVVSGQQDISNSESESDDNGYCEGENDLKEESEEENFLETKENLNLKEGDNESKVWPKTGHFVCSICSISFSKIGWLNKHIICHMQDLFHCGTCNAQFDSLDHLTKHRNEVHSCDRPYKCDTCDRRFRKKDSLNDHKGIHRGDKPYVCPLCNRAFRLKNSLVRHTRLHTGEKPFQCETCGTAFAHKHLLKAHFSNMHVEDKPFHCPVCGMGFGVAINLKRHVMLHTGERPYMCEECGCRFIQHHQLQQHLRKHTGATPYRCPDCSNCFKYRSSLDLHRTKAHNYVRTRKRPKVSRKRHYYEPAEIIIPDMEVSEVVVLDDGDGNTYLIDSDKQTASMILCEVLSTMANQQTPEHHSSEITAVH